MRALILASAATVALAPAAFGQQNQSDATGDSRSPGQEQAAKQDETKQDETKKDETKQSEDQAKSADTSRSAEAGDSRGGEEVQAEADRPVGKDENLKPEGAGLTWRSDLTEVTPRNDYQKNLESLREQRQAWEEQGKDRLAELHQGPEFRQAMERLRQARQDWAQAQSEMQALERRAQQQGQQSAQQQSAQQQMERRQQAMRQQQAMGQQDRQRGMTAQRMTELRPTTVTCRELTNYDTAFVPGMVYWIDGYVMARNARGQAAVEPVVRMRQDWFALPTDRIMQACANQPNQPAAVVISAQRERMMNENGEGLSAEVPEGAGPEPREALSENSGSSQGGNDGEDGEDQQNQ